MVAALGRHLHRDLDWAFPGGPRARWRGPGWGAV